ncbi:hypothetical protein [Streptomyces hokutonensis]|uniref:hypothetical protein n=1 Tax=Streptomyces hokutonensis TaxID=1306990 RepID=UPI0033CC579C
MRIAEALALTLVGTVAALVFALSGHGQAASADAGPTVDGVHAMATPLGDSGWQ